MVLLKHALLSLCSSPGWADPGAAPCTSSGSQGPLLGLEQLHGDEILSLRHVTHSTAAWCHLQNSRRALSPSGWHWWRCWVGGCEEETKEPDHRTSFAVRISLNNYINIRTFHCLIRKVTTWQIKKLYQWFLYPLAYYVCGHQIQTSIFVN